MQFYVINLIRRIDRKQKLLNTWKKCGLGVYNINFVEAVDGSYISNEDLNTLLNRYKLEAVEKNIKNISRFLSHLITIEKIANSNEEYGIVLEDDIEIEDKVVDQIKILEPIIKNYIHKNKLNILFFSCFNINKISPQIHIFKKKIDNCKERKPKKHYLITKNAAAVILEKTINTFIIKEFKHYISSFFNKKIYYTNNIIKCTKCIKCKIIGNSKDSDINSSISLKYNIEIDERKFPSITFLISTVNKPEQLLNVIKNIVYNTYNKDKISFVLYRCINDTNTDKILKSVKEFLNKYSIMFCITSGFYKNRNMLNSVYYKLWRCYFKYSDIFAFWDDNTFINTNNWDLYFFKSYIISGKPKLASFHLNGSIKKHNNFNEFHNPLVTRELLMCDGESFFYSPYLEDYISTITYISSISIMFNDIRIYKNESNTSQKNIINMYNDIYTSFYTKTKILDAIDSVISNKNYSNCGKWIDMNALYLKSNFEESYLKYKIL